MRRSPGWIFPAASLLSVLLLQGQLAAPAAASTTYIPLVIGQSITASGLTFTVTGCSLTIASAPAGACATSGAYAMELLALPGPTAQVQVQNLASTATASVPIFSTAASAPSGQIYDLTYTLSVQKSVATAKTTVTNVSTALAGVGPAAYLSKISLSDKLFAGTTGQNGTPSGAVLGTQAISLASASLTATNNITATSALSVTTDLHLVTQTGSILTLSSVRQSYGPAPEPVTVGVFLIGLTGLGAARLRRRARG